VDPPHGWGKTPCWEGTLNRDGESFVGLCLTGGLGKNLLGGVNPLGAKGNFVGGI
jgi:hypothetical protein